MVRLRSRLSNTPARVIKLHGRGSHKGYLSVHRLHSSGRGCDAASIDLPSKAKFATAGSSATLRV
ncbi:hypothetical protein ABH973_000795 [Bradyrhizobium ottawaense]